jgi:hypothetical protein
MITGAAPVMLIVSQVMSEANPSQFVLDVADEFFRRYQQPADTDDRDGELWIRCRDARPSRLRSPLTFGVTNHSITVAFDGLTVPVFIQPPLRDAATVRGEAFALFDDLITDRKVAISFWKGDECIAVEFIPHEEIQSRRDAWHGYAARVRSWSGRYDCEEQG